MAKTLKSLAEQSLEDSDIIARCNKISMDNVFDTYAGKITICKIEQISVHDIDMETGEHRGIRKMFIAELKGRNEYINCGYKLNQLFNNLLYRFFQGDIDELNKLLGSEGLKVQLTKTETRMKNEMITVRVID